LTQDLLDYPNILASSRSDWQRRVSSW